MTLTRWCVVFVGIALIASILASCIGRPDYFWKLALVLGVAAAWHLTGVRPLKGAAMALMALDAACVVLWTMAGDFFETFRERFQGRWQGSKRELEDWE